MLVTQVLKSQIRNLKPRYGSRPISRPTNYFEELKKKRIEEFMKGVENDDLTPEAANSVLKEFSRNQEKDERCGEWQRIKKLMQPPEPKLLLLGSKMQLEIQKDCENNINFQYLSEVAERFYTTPEAIKKIAKRNNSMEIEVLIAHDLKVLHNWRLLLKFGLSSVLPEIKDIILEFYEECKNMIEKTTYVNRQPIRKSKGPFGEIARSFMPVSIESGDEVKSGVELFTQVMNERLVMNRDLRKPMKRTVKILVQHAEKKLKARNLELDHSESLAVPDPMFDSGVGREVSIPEKVDTTSMAWENGMYRKGKDFYSEDGEYLYSVSIAP